MSSPALEGGHGPIEHADRRAALGFCCFGLQFAVEEAHVLKLAVPALQPLQKAMPLLVPQQSWP